MNMTKQEFDSKMLRLQQGDEHAFEEIYSETQRGLFSFILSICRNYHTAEDMMQVTYIKLRSTISQYKIGANPYAWLYTIAKNVTINELNKQKRETAVDVDENIAQFGTYEMQVNESPLTVMMNKILNDNERQIVTLHISGFKHKEIAEMLEKPLGTVLWTYNNALNKLRKELQKEENL